MTQLQNIIEEIKKAEGAAILDAWIKSISEGKEVEVIKEARESVKENRGRAVRIFGLYTVELIEDFNPIKQVDIHLSELFELCKVDRDSRNLEAIKVKIMETNLLFEMANVKL